MRSSRKRQFRAWQQQPYPYLFGFQFSDGLTVAFSDNMLRNFEAYQMAKRLYQSCKVLKIPRFLQEQLQRASASVVLNLAEGSGKRTPNDQRRFYSIAFGSLRECRAVLEMEQITDPALHQFADQLSAILYVLSRRSDALPCATVTEDQTVTDTDSAAAAEQMTHF